MKETVKVKIKFLDNGGVLPEKASKLAGGWDVCASKIEQKEEDLVICYLGFALQFPEKYKVTLVPRSSITKTKWILQNSPGLGDPDYTGPYQYRFRALPNGISECFAGCRLTYPEFPFKIGERIGQIYLEEIIPTEFEIVEELDETDRGSGGFGSTGLK